MSRYINKLAITAKIETVYGTDAVPTGAANAMQMNNITYTPMDGEEESRDLVLPYLGNQGVELTGDFCRLEGDIEMAGAGAAGTVPAYGPLLRACGFAEVISAGTMVEYSPVSGGFEAVSIYYNLDGVRHIMLGARGNLQLVIEPKKIPKFRFSMMGLLGTISDAALPAVTLTGFTRGRAVSKARTTFSLDALAAPMSSLNINMGHQVEARHLVNYEAIEISDRKASGTVVVDAGAIASKNWYALAQARTKVAMAVVHGLVAGDIVALAAPALEVGRPTYSDSSRIVNNSLPLMLTPTAAGSDELKITVR